jgi:hypothetical protein
MLQWIEKYFEFRVSKNLDINNKIKEGFKLLINASLKKLFTDGSAEVR